MALPAKIYRYPLPIGNLKYLTSYLSRRHVVLLARKKGLSPNLDQEDNISLAQHRKIRQYAAAAGFWFDTDFSQHIEDFSVVRIYKNAPVLFKLINRLERSFQVIMQADPLSSKQKPGKMILATAYDYAARLPAIIQKASYFLTSWEVWTVNPDSKLLTSQVGYNRGLANRKENSVSYNLEFRLDLDVLLHEVIHLKHRDWNERITHEAAALVAPDCPALLARAAGLKAKLDREFYRTACDFARFDHKVGQILGINKSAGCPQLKPGGLAFPLNLEKRPLESPPGSRLDRNPALALASIPSP
jgi:hypothetical protein